MDDGWPSKTYLFTFGSNDRELSPSEVLMCHPTYAEDAAAPQGFPALSHGLWAPKLATMDALKIPEVVVEEGGTKHFTQYSVGSARLLDLSLQFDQIV